MDMIQSAAQAKKASITLASVSSEQKNHALKTVADYLINNIDKIVRANEEDIQRSKKENLPETLIKRLKFDGKKIRDVVDGINSLINLDDPIGKKLMATELDEALNLYKISCPIGVIGIIFESRPDALVQISTLCLKSGNAVLLKGGSEAMQTNRILAELIQKATDAAGIGTDWIHLLETRDDVNKMLKLDRYIDLLIPRGSNEFVQYIMDNSRIPVLGHADGICHCYVDKDADLEMAVDIVNDSKTQYVSVCNATETLLVHSEVANRFLPKFKEVIQESNVQLRGCENTRKIIDVTVASERDWKTEYLDYILSIKVVNSLEEAIEHINTYGSGHTDSIITENKEIAQKFMDLVDSANVFWNCSTRFSDGFRFGFGAEVGISTNKIHARGPVGLDGLTIYKYKLIGNGHIVSDYAEHRRKFTHKPIA
ncbi:MAG: glutamate-5-semialdehyde dehydrogenase [Clostridiaceae bacterium]|jgi:glutamate-5-semialdehyde dehydrogenase|nr:glutamate-5-semialdehyde dehydrogenase [Clostridiaceae bacterium]